MWMEDRTEGVWGGREGRDTAECAGVDPTEEEREESARSEVKQHRCRNWYSSGRAVQWAPRGKVGLENFTLVRHSMSHLKSHYMT